MIFTCIEPLPPTSLNITTRIERTSDTNVFFEWEPPTGSGPEYVIESYDISVMSEFGYDYINDTVSSPTWNTTLEYNEKYSVAVVSINCAGESEPIELEDILFSEYAVDSEVHAWMDAC